MIDGTLNVSLLSAKSLYIQAQGLGNTIGEATAFVHGDMAFVVCEERLPGGVLVATNVFVREDGDWKICHHHAAPVARPIVRRSPESLN